MTVKTVDQLMEKWAPVLDAQGEAQITDKHRRETTAVLLENTEAALLEQRALMEDVPTNATQGYPTNGTGLAKYDPVLISMVRRSAPISLAYDFCGVQPLRQPTGLIFALRSRYGKQDSGIEALFQEANSAFSGTGTHAGTNPGDLNADQDPSTAGLQPGTYSRGVGLDTTVGETLGGGGANPEFAEMSFTVEQISVTAKTRALKASYTVEFAQDLKNLHGLDADGELSTILTREVNADLNRELLGTMYRSSKIGAQDATTPGVFNLLTDSDGRWLAERHKGLMFQIEREANRIAQETRMGKGNFVICSSDVASALAMTGSLSYTPGLAGNSNLNVDETSATFVGTLNGKIKVYVDPYAGAAGTDAQFLLVGYKGASAWDAGMYYCPYVPMQFVRTTDPNTFTPRMAVKMRYGIVQNPFYSLNSRQNAYYRLIKVGSLL